MLLGPSGTIARLLASVHAHCNWLDIHAQNVKSKQTKIKKKTNQRKKETTTKTKFMAHICHIKRFFLVDFDCVCRIRKNKYICT